jgi:hypothetical protein
MYTIDPFFSYCCTVQSELSRFYEVEKKTERNGQQVPVRLIASLHELGSSHMTMPILSPQAARRHFDRWQLQATDKVHAHCT